MTQLYVRVSLHGVVADQRLCSVGDEVWLGSVPDAVVSFPGPSIQVRRIGSRLQAHGRWLDAGCPMRLKRGDLEVTLESVEVAGARREWSLPMPDLRVLVASAAVVLLGAWWEAVGDFMQRHPDAVAALTGRDSVIVQPAYPDAAPPLRARVQQAEGSRDGVEDTATTATTDTAAAPAAPASYPVGFIETHEP